MYQTCIFCTRPLGTNEVIERFPVGRRLAFDSARGRLWVVCQKCERWNLSPLEERWEAVEACERLFRETRARVSTENIGLARLSEGLELVRIGKPLRPEFAAWRYGDQFGRRRRRAILIGGGAAAALSTFVIGGVITGVVSSTLLAQSGNFVNLWVNGRTLLKLPLEGGRILKLKNQDLQVARLLPDADHGWSFEVGRGKKKTTFLGSDAQHAAGLVLPKLNQGGGSRRTVGEAVQFLESRGGPEALVESVAVATARVSGGPGQRRTTGTADATAMFVPRRLGQPRPVGEFGSLTKPARLALEMALHEERERLALEGELATLEAAWREAEEIAAIADDLLLPPGIGDFIQRHRGGGT